MIRVMIGPDPSADLWRDYVEGVRRRPGRAFEEDAGAFRRIFAGRPEEAGPPPVWRPDAAQAAASNLGRLMADRGCRDYAALHAWSAADRAGYWGEAIDRLGIVFGRRPSAVLDDGGGPEQPRWLPDARLNIADSCFRARPDRPAILVAGEDGAPPRTVTYGEVEALANRVANGLRARGFAAGDAVALYLPMTVECVAAYLGVVRAGCAVVSIADSFSAEELARRCRIGGARAVIASASYARAGRVIDLYAKVRAAGAPPAFVIPPAAGGGAAPADPPGGSAALRDGDLPWSALLARDASWRSEAADPYATTNILFSSGTTREPKAIPWTHLTPIKCAADARFHQDVRPDDVLAWPTSIGWMMGPWLIYAAFINDAAMALYEGVPTGPGFCRFVKDAGVTILGLVPSLVRAWRNAGAARPGDWDRVRVFSSTGEPSSREDYLWLMGLADYRAPVVEYLGGTEIGGGHVTGTVVQAASPATFTTPALGIDFVLLDESGSPAAPGGAGELFLIPPSIGLSQTLLNDDHHRVYYEGCPAGPRGEILRRHGDLFARLHGGFLKAQGRADDTMNLGGIKVSALELEQVLDGHPEVVETAAVAVQPEGEGADRLVVFAVLREPGGAAGAARERLMRSLQELIGRRLNPLFRIHDLVAVEALPRTASNKMMRRALRAGYRPDGGRG
jgi:acetyl-CoA synthetase